MAPSRLPDLSPSSPSRLIFASALGACLGFIGCQATAPAGQTGGVGGGSAQASGGGKTGTGGAAAGSGGSASGGAPGSGGGSGGAVGGGASGGANGTADGGGSENTGGNASGGAAGDAGPAGSGGAGAGGQAGSPDTGPSDPGGPPVTSSQACGQMMEAPKEGLHEITVGGAVRKFFLRIPTAYDGKKPWPVIFAFHGAGNKSAAWFDTNTDLRAVTEEKAVLVFGEGATRPDGTLSWVHLSPQNVLFVDAMIDWLKKTLCIDPSHLFAVGQSSGGYMSMTLGCQRGNVFRAVATSSGGILEPGTCTGRPGAVWIRTGRGDTASTRQSVQETRDFWVRHKTCSAEAPKPTAPAPCVKWSGCQEGAAVVYCEDGGGHEWPAYYSRALLAQFGL